MKNYSLMNGNLLRCWILLVVATAPIQAQQAEPITVNTDLVTTWGQVTNRQDGSPVTGLILEDFFLYEESKQQQIAFVKQGQPLSVVILMDGMTCVRHPKLSCSEVWRHFVSLEMTLKLP
jgi:hypothetical protein